jgi:hypothetical protein
MRSPDWLAACTRLCDQPVLLITSMPGIRVIDAHGYIGCHCLLPLKVHHQLTLAGIEGVTFRTSTEKSDLPCAGTNRLEVDDYRRRPRYLTRKGNLRIQKCPCSWLPTIPATVLHDGGVGKNPDSHPAMMVAQRTMSRWWHIATSVSLRAFASAHATTRIPEGRKGFIPRFSTRLLSIPTSMDDGSCTGSGWKTTGVSILGSRRVVPTGRLAIRGAVRRVSCMPVFSLDMLDALPWRDVSQLLQQNEVTQRR